VTITDTFSITPATFAIAPIRAKYRTGRLNFDADKKFETVEFWIWAKYQLSATAPKVRLLYNNNPEPGDTDKNFTYNEDGVSWTANTSDYTIDPTVVMHKYRIPGSQWKQDCALEIYSDAAGEAWNIMRCKLIATVDNSWDPARK
jgi:hypothetical protein